MVEEREFVRQRRGRGIVDLERFGPLLSQPVELRADGLLRPDKDDAGDAALAGLDGCLDDAGVRALRQDDRPQRAGGVRKDHFKRLHGGEPQLMSFAPATTKAAMKSVSATIRKMAWPPTSSTRLREVFIPTAETDRRSAQRDTSDSSVEIPAGIAPKELRAAKIRKATTKNGMSGGRAPVELSAPMLLRMTSDRIRMTGASIVTRMSLTSVATSPAESETEKPAPTTCATSWIVPPMKTPDWLSSIAIHPANIG